MAAAYPPLRLGNNLLRRVGAKSDARVRVLICHDIALQEQVRFSAQLRWLMRSWTFVSPQQFAAMMSRDEPIKGANLLLSFDDGFASNRRVAEQVLNPMGIQALFFVVSAFVDLVEGDDCRSFIARHICPGLPPEAVPDDWRNMTWNDLAWLLETGHTIGAHTRTHACLSELRQGNELQAEIIDSANVLERNLGVKVEHFAYPLGNLASFSPAALAVARQRFSFIYTGLRGDNARGAPPWSLRRDAIAPSNSLGLVGFLLEGGADIRYAWGLAQCKSWG
ncbi:MAG: polysaccharide deacetylase family protein [Chloroflexota bacterium]